MAKIMIEIEHNGKSCGDCNIRKATFGDFVFCPAFNSKELTWGDDEFPIRLPECIAAEVENGKSPQ